MKQGIHVSGFWKIDVVNPDGTIASHHEFENSLQRGGQSLIIGLLAGIRGTFGSWELALQTTSTTIGNYYMQQGPIAFVGTPGYVPGQVSDTPTFINPSSCNSTTVNCAVTLAVTPSISSGTIVLAGYTQPLTDTATVNAVATMASSCDGSLLLGQCLLSVDPDHKGLNVFTFYSLSTNTNPAGPIQFSVGQILQVTVTLSFF